MYVITWENLHCHITHLYSKTWYTPTDIHIITEFYKVNTQVSVKTASEWSSIADFLKIKNYIQNQCQIIFWLYVLLKLLSTFMRFPVYKSHVSNFFLTEEVKHNFKRTHLKPLCNFTIQLCHMTFTMWCAETSTGIRIIKEKRGSQLFVGVPLNEIQQSMYNKYFLHLNKKAQMERLPNNGDELQNVARNAEY